jgi:hypothetical protein
MANGVRSYVHIQFAFLFVVMWSLCSGVGPVFFLSGIYSGLFVFQACCPGSVLLDACGWFCVPLELFSPRL